LAGLRGAWRWLCPHPTLISDVGPRPSEDAVRDRILEAMEFAARNHRAATADVAAAPTGADDGDGIGGAERGRKSA